MKSVIAYRLVRHTLPALALAVGLACTGGSLRAETLYVADPTDNQILTFTAAGSTGSVFADASDGLNLPRGLAFDRSGNLFTINTGGNTISKIDRSGAATQPWAFPHGGYGGLAFDNSNRLYGADTTNSQVLRFSNGNPSGTTFTSGVGQPDGLAFDASGNLYVLTYTGTIDKVTPGGTVTTFATGLGARAVGLAFDNAGNLYASSYGLNEILKFGPSGGTGTVFADSSDGLSHPVGIAFNAAGDLFVANNGANDILDFNASGAASVYADASDGINAPWSVAFDDVTLPVPEPATWAGGALLIGAAGWTLRRQRVTCA